MKSSIVYLGDCFKCYAKLKMLYSNVVTIEGLKINQTCMNCLRND